MTTNTDQTGLLNEYSFKDGELVHIESVERGLACGCVCPSCEGRMVAKKGEVKRKHFAHHKNTNCMGGVETVLHEMGKEIIIESGRVLLPNIDIHLVDRDLELNTLEEKHFSEGKQIRFVHVEDEVRFTTDPVIVPDLVAETASGEIYLIEIFVTHKVDGKKLDFIKNTGALMFEIDLRKYIPQIQLMKDKTELQKFVLKTAKRYWISNKELEDKELELQQRLDERVRISNKLIEDKSKKDRQQKMYQDNFHRREEMEQIHLKAQLKYEREEWRKDNAEQIESLALFSKDESIIERRGNLDNKNTKFWDEVESEITISRDNLAPVFTDEVLDKYVFFKVPDPVWRVGIYKEFILNADMQFDRLDVDDVALWCVKKFGLIEPISTFFPVWHEQLKTSEKLYNDYLTDQELLKCLNPFEGITLYFEKLKYYHFLNKNNAVINKSIPLAKFSYENAGKEREAKALTSKDPSKPIDEYRNDIKKRSLQLAIMEAWSRTSESNYIIKCDTCYFVFPLEEIRQGGCPFCGNHETKEYQLSLTLIKDLYNRNKSSSTVSKSLNYASVKKGKDMIISIIGLNQAMKITKKIAITN